MFLYAEGSFDPDYFLSKEDMRAIRQGLADVKAGRVITQEEMFRKMGLRIVIKKI
jgi:predicted transcriptional regulator